MPDDRTASSQDEPASPALGASLPADLHADLAEAFAAEVAERLPRLLALLDGPPAPGAARDAHALAGSAVVVGAQDAARAARRLEVALAGTPSGPDVRALVTDLARQLAGPS